MPSIGHIAVGAAAGRLQTRSRRNGTSRAMILLSAASLAPDADGVSFLLGIPYGASWGHRGASHSLSLALAIGLAAGAVGRAWKLPFSRTALFAAAAAASHGLFDSMTDGGLGVALLWPFSNRRLFAPWRPIPVAPIGAAMFSRRGLEVVVAELLLFAPFWAYGFWPRRGRRQ